MAANPGDFVRPEPIAPANGARRAEVIRTYSQRGNTGWQPAPETKLIDRGLEGSN